MRVSCDFLKDHVCNQWFLAHNFLTLDVGDVKSLKRLHLFWIGYKHRRCDINQSECRSLSLQYTIGIVLEPVVEFGG